MGLTWSTPASATEAAPPSFGLLPYSVGLLKSYATAHAAERHDWLLPIYARVPVADGVEALEEADVVGFSVYVWNVRLSLAIAAELKRRRPETLIVFGGPQVPERPAAAEAFLREHPHVDIVTHGEGEVTFTALLDRAPTHEFGDVDGISFIDDSGRFVSKPRGPRLTDLEQIPSPYLTGAFDDLFEAYPHNRWVMIWETNRGCPFSCTFCDWGSATASKVLRFDMERLVPEIDWMSSRQMGFVFCADANFGALKRDLELTQRVVDIYQRTGFPFSLSVQSTKNATDRIYAIQKLLNTSLNAYGVTLALQSVNEATLADIKRANISAESYRELQRRFAADGVYTYSDLILGLPGETYDEFVSGISRVIADGQHNHIQFHNCSVLPNAEMGDPEYQRRFEMTYVPQVIRNVHDRIEEKGWEVEESLDTVVATAAMPAADWRRAKVFAWMTDFVYFDRVLQIPLLVLHARHDWPVHELIEELIAADPGSCPTIASVVAQLEAKALSIQEGGPEYFPIPEAGGLLWPGDQRSLISLVIDRGVDAFYDEAGEILSALLERRACTEDFILLDEALRLNRAALTLPFETESQLLLLSHNVWDYYEALLVHGSVELQEGFFAHHVNRSRKNWTTLEAWSQHLSWAHGKDKRGYLRSVSTPPQGANPAMRAQSAA